ncbi:vegetative cell wall protein gp1-like [Oryza glaberrima]|uniref:vegetative cell wall protein gp1-like n=1 Tax=Oryza glaberrima TaxID=4538 RepID=UPI00224C201A|nr:vegetative cell wall protein gp1-like [Oryza glaberrima]
MAALSAPGAGAPTAAKPPPLSSQAHNAPPMTGAARPASLGAATAATPSPPVQNAPQMTAVPRPASFGAAAARVSSPSPSTQNAPQMIGGPRPVNLGAPVARGTAARAPSPSPTMQRQNATPMTGVPRPASFGASGAAATTARGPSPSLPVQNAPSMRGAIRAPWAAPPMQGASPAGMVPAGQSSHIAVTGIPAAPLQHKRMRRARAAMAQAMVPRSSHTAVLSTVRPHAPLSNAQGAPSMAMSPGVPTIPTPTGNPHVSQQQRAAMARHPAPTSSRAIGAPIQPTEPHAPLPNTGGEGAPPPARTMPPPSSQAATSTPPAAATPLQRPPAQATAQPSTQRYYVGVQRDKGTGKWAACVVDPSNPTKHRLVGAFPDEHAAALALCAATSSPGSHCGLVAGGDKYDEKYSEFLRKIYHGVMDNSPSYKKFFDVILDFFIARAREIGREALEDGGDMLVERFVAMHKNKAVTPRWRAWYRRKVEEAHAKQVDAQQRLRQQAMEEAQAKQVAAQQELQQQEAMANKHFEDTSVHDLSFPYTKMRNVKILEAALLAAYCFYAI